MERLARLAEQLLASVEAFKLRENLNYYAPSGNITITPENEREDQFSISGVFRTVTATAQPASSGVYNALAPAGANASSSPYPILPYQQNNGAQTPYPPYERRQGNAMQAPYPPQQQQGNGARQSQPLWQS